MRRCLGGWNSLSCTHRGKANALFAPLLQVTSTILFPTEPAASPSTCTGCSILTHTPPAWTRSRSLPWQTCLLFKEPKPAGQGEAGRGQTGGHRPAQGSAAASLPRAPRCRPRCRGRRPSSLSALGRSPRQEGGSSSPWLCRGGALRGNPGRAGRARLTQCGLGQEAVAEAELWRLRPCAGGRSPAFRP